MAIYEKKSLSPETVSAVSTMLAKEAQQVHDSKAGLQPTLQRAFAWIQQENYPSAVELLRASGYDSQILDTLGVCLMRLGEIEQAVQVYRSFVLAPATVLVRPGISKVCIRNFATALLMKGFPSGALEVLTELGDPDSDRTVQIRSAIRRWEQSLSMFRWLDWKLNAIEPPHCNVSIDFKPGELEFETVLKRPNQPNRRHADLAA